MSSGRIDARGNYQNYLTLLLLDLLLCFICFSAYKDVKFRTITFNNPIYGTQVNILTCAYISIITLKKNVLVVSWFLLNSLLVLVTIFFQNK